MSTLVYAEGRAVRAPETTAAGPATDRFTSALRGFGPLGILAILVILSSLLLAVPLAAVLVLLWVRWSRTPWSEIGYVRPRSWTKDLAAGALLGVALKLVMKAMVMPLFRAEAVNHAYHFLVGNTAALPAMVAAVVVGGGWAEETVYRGYFFERLGKLFGKGALASVAIVLISAAVFALAHYSGQGVAGVEQAIITGTIFGAIFARTGRLWLVMWAHAAFDLMAIAIIYLDLETTVAHLIFK